MFKKFCEKKSFIQAIRFVLEKPLRRSDPYSVIQLSDVCNEALTDEGKALKSTISTFRIYSYFQQLGVTA